VGAATARTALADSRIPDANATAVCADAIAASFSPAAAPERPGLPPGALHVESLDLDAQGVAHRADGKVVFIEGALPFEVVSVNVHRRKNNWEQGVVQAIHQASAQRVTPACPHFGLHAGACGGCKMQHLHPAAQVAVKQRALEDSLWHLGKVRAQTLLRPIEGPAWGYRYRARLSVRDVLKKGVVLVGFHERKSRYVADMQRCPVLAPQVDAMLLPLRALLASLHARQTCPQIEVACGDDGVTALVLRHLAPLGDADVDKLRAFAIQHRVQWWLQPGGPDTVQRLDQSGPLLAYHLDAFGITMPFKPTDFTQVNPHINRVLVARALRLLDVQRDERVIDWFCGLGNFTLPLATQSKEVLGLEGSETLVQRARDNAAFNATRQAPGSVAQAGLHALRFAARNLFDIVADDLPALGVAQKWLIDPPREGAFALAKALADLHQNPALAPAWQAPQRIVYVSCNPATLARDAGLLVHQAGYHCRAAGVVNMFPHTAHVESMAVFER